MNRSLASQNPPRLGVVAVRQPSCYAEEALTRATAAQHLTGPVTAE